MYKFTKATDEKVESQNSAIKKNPKEHLKAISLRSGKTLDDPYADRQGKLQELEQVNEGENKRDSELLKEQKDKGNKVQKNELMTNPFYTPPFSPKAKKRKA